MNRLRSFNIIISVLFSLMIISIFGLFIIGYILISDNRSTLAENEYRISKVDEAEDNLSSLEKRYNLIKNDLIKINTALPDQKDSSLIVSDLDSLANSSGLKLVLIKSAITGKKSSSSDLSLLQTIKGKYGYEIPIEIKVDGSFGSLSDFISKIESSQRLLNITYIDISKVSRTGDMSDSIEAKIKLTAYLKK